MFAGIPNIKDFSLFALRRKELVKQVKEQFKNLQGKIVLFAGFEKECAAFRQESSFYYFTGIEEPGVVLVLDLDSMESTLYVPNCVEKRSQWMFSDIPLVQESAKDLKLDTIAVLGKECTGYQFHPFFPKEEYTHMIVLLENMIKHGEKIFTLSPDNASEYAEQRLILERLNMFVPNIKENIVNISPIVTRMRRTKDMQEIEQLYKAVEVTILAQEAAAQSISDGATECEVQASLEYMMTGSCARTSFPSIVASGKNSTVLHYTINSGMMKNGDLVVVDIGADVDYYCADLTRTYPVSGKFTPRQKEIYTIVLETQEYIASLAKPGMWLSNKDEEEKSLHHLAKKYLKEKGYDQYFPHGIGHFLGLDVHDVGDYKEPLQENDVITIEPGIYIPEENIGVRIEDDYWIVKDGAVCLSDGLPKKAADIERLVQQQLEDRKGASEMEYEDIFSDADDTEH